MDIQWKGEGIDEKCYWLNSKEANNNSTKNSPPTIVVVDPRYFRPTEVETLLGDPSNAQKKLGWKPKISFSELVAEMVSTDLEIAMRDELVKRHGYQVKNYNE